jgi:hypothetical protein
MVRASRIASEVALYAFTASALWPGLSVPLAVVAFVAICAAIAFRLHDTGLPRGDVSFRNEGSAADAE